jgi:histidyl-tRNA synthetase
VGSSIGLDRLTAALESLGKLPERRGYALLGIAWGGEEEAGRRQALAEEFRALGIPCEALLDEQEDGAEAPGKAAKALVRQFVQAEKKGIPWVLIPAAGGEMGLRDIAARQTREHLSVQDAAEIVKPR